MNNGLVALGRSGLHSLDSNGKLTRTHLTEPLVGNVNGYGVGSGQICISLADKAKLVFIAEDQTFRASVPELMMCVEYSSQGELLFCGSKSGKVYIWQVRTGELLFCDFIFYNEVTDLKVDERDNTLLVSSSNGDLCLLNLLQLFTGGEFKSHFVGHTCHILSVSNLLFGLHSSRLSFLSVSRDRDLRFWKRGKVESLESIQLASNPVKIHPDRIGVRSYISCEDGNLVIVHLEDLRLKYVKLHTYSSVVTDKLVSVGFDGVKVYDIEAQVIVSQHQIGLGVSALFGGPLPASRFKFRLLKFTRQDQNRPYTLVI